MRAAIVGCSKSLRRVRGHGVSGFVMLLISLLCPVRLAAQQNCLSTLPTTELSDDAAVQWANCITSQLPPPGPPQQIIYLGTFDVASGTLNWNQVFFPPPYLHANVQCYAQGEYGPVPAPCPPIPPAPNIGSFNVSYEITILNKPAGYDLQVVLTNPTVGGGKEEIVGTIPSSGKPGTGSSTHATPQQTGSYGPQPNLPQSSTVIAMPFHPRIVAEQTLMFLHSGTLLKSCRGAQPGLSATGCSYKIDPIFQPQLGSFVVHYLPAAIIYQPPGSMSHSGFTNNTSYGTTYCWGTSTTAGTIRTEDASAFFGTNNNAGSVVNGIAQLTSAAGSVPGPVGTAASVIGGVLSALHSAFDVQTTTSSSQQHGLTGCRGASLTVTQGYDTDPGRGNRYVLLTSALFVYVVVLIDPATGLIVPSNGVPTVILTMISSTPNAPFMDDLLNPQNNYPAELVAQLRTLDVDLNPHAAARLKGPFHDWDPLCYAESGSDNHVGLSSDDYTSTDISTSTITTTTTEVSGWFASFVGATSHTTQSFTISSNQSNWSHYGTESLLSLSCPEINPPYLSWEMSYKLDPLFGTLLAIPGPKCTSVQGCGSDSTSFVAGVVTDQNGNPLRNTLLVFKIGGRSYRVYTHSNGKFALHTPPLPKGNGAILIGNESFPLVYSGAPLSNLSLRMGSGPTSIVSRVKNNGEVAKVGNVPNAITACCSVTSINEASASVVARVNDTGQSFQFMVKDSALLYSLRVGEGVFANFKTGQVSIDGKHVCCDIVSSATIKPGANLPTTGGAPTDNRAPSGGPCCQITAVSLQNQSATAKVNATGQVFQFIVSNRALLRGLNVGEGVYADFAAKQVSLDGRHTAGKIISMGPITTSPRPLSETQAPTVPAPK